MSGLFDHAVQKAALNTVRELIDAGLAGLDCYDHDIFVVDAPDEQRELADVALDNLGATFRQVGPLGAVPPRIECHLPQWVRAELRLDVTGAPELLVPLASRAVARREELRMVDPTASETTLTATAVLHTLIDDVSRSH